MNIMKKRPGVILLPVSAVFIIFIILLFLLIGQKRNNSAILLEYRASRIMSIMLDFYVEGDIPDPAELDENILGFGIYTQEGRGVFLFGTAPPRLNAGRMLGNEITINKNRSIRIVRSVFDTEDFMNGNTAPRPPRGMGQHLRDRNDQNKRGSGMMPMMRKYQAGVYLEYSNSSYITERRLIILIILLFAASFTFLSVLIYNLYNSNRRLTIKSEHEKQLIQLGEAARTLAHEIRNPLGTLKVQRDLLKKKLPEGYEGNLETIDRELKRLNTLVERVGDFLRNPVGKRSVIDLSVFLSSLYEDRIDVRLDGLPPEAGICFNSERLRTVVDNVINNAVDSGGEAMVRITDSGNYLILQVEDGGEGIPEELLGRIFEPFFTTKDKGSGLGLAVVKQLMEASGGWVKIENNYPGVCARLGFRKTGGEDCENISSR
ncbi:MAG: HAMP domain-containing histidine kinase [Spirochaetales bacterium]|nr:HAMP domain-containing histidine kinase [Spirochaetales bacterium]